MGLWLACDKYCNHLLITSSAEGVFHHDPQLMMANNKHYLMRHFAKSLLGEVDLIWMVNCTYLSVLSCFSPWLDNVTCQLDGIEGII